MAAMSLSIPSTSTISLPCDQGQATLHGCLHAMTDWQPLSAKQKQPKNKQAASCRSTLLGSA